MTGFGTGIRRGTMAADRFTQISNQLFRDRRISFKAKGLFGLISTHRNGWQVTLAELARTGPDGQSAVRSGLKELETHGYLVRTRLRNVDGTLGDIVYEITDQPDLAPAEAAPTLPPPRENGRPRPTCDFPTLADPTLADRSPKNTSRKNTTSAGTPSVPPAPLSAEQPPRAHHTLTPGESLLLSIGAAQPAYLITGKSLKDQARAADQLLASGWTTAQLRHVITGRSLPHPIRNTVAAIIAARLRAARHTPPPDSAHSPSDEPPASAADRPVGQALSRRVLAECAGCGRPHSAAEQDLCPVCLDWPRCRTCTGPTPRRAHPDSDGRCTTCAHQTATV